MAFFYDVIGYTLANCGEKKGTCTANRAKEGRQGWRFEVERERKRWSERKRREEREKVRKWERERERDGVREREDKIERERDGERKKRERREEKERERESESKIERGPNSICCLAAWVTLRNLYTTVNQHSEIIWLGQHLQHLSNGI